MVRTTTGYATPNSPDGDCTTSPKHDGDGIGLLGVEEREAPGDVVPLARVRPDIVEGWTAAVEAISSGADLGETVIEAPASGRRIRLRPRRTTEPTGAVEWHERPHGGAAARYVRTVDGLKRAVRVAVTWPYRSPAERQATRLSGATA